MSHQLVPVPMRSKVLDILGHLSRDLVRFLDSLRNWLSATGRQIGDVALTAQSAAITTTDVPATTLDGTLYRASYSLRITQAATTSSSAQLTLGWTSDSVSCAQTFAAVTGNTTATQQSDVIVIAADSATTVTYAVAYSSTGATSMTYALDIRLEVLP